MLANRFSKYNFHDWEEIKSIKIGYFSTLRVSPLSNLILHFRSCSSWAPASKGKEVVIPLRENWGEGRGNTQEVWPKFLNTGFLNEGGFPAMDFTLIFCVQETDFTLAGIKLFFAMRHCQKFALVCYTVRQYDKAKKNPGDPNAHAPTHKKEGKEEKKFADSQLHLK